VPAGGVDSMQYNPNDSFSYFSFTAPDSGVKVIPFTISDSSSNVWRDTVRFTVVPFAQPIHRSIVNHVAGISEWGFNVNVTNPGAVLNHLYEITVQDTILIDTNFNSSLEKLFTLRNLTNVTTLLDRHPLPDAFGHNIPVTDGFKVVQGGENFGLIGLRQDSTRWISPNPVWIRGDRFFSDPHSAFSGGATTGYMLGIFYLGAVESNFDPSRSFTVEVRFNAVQPQLAYRLRRIGTYQLQDYVDVPFAVWDVTNRAAPRQLAVAWRDNNNNGIWDPSTAGDGVEVAFIYNKTYNPAGGQFTTEPNNATVGANADIVYGLSLAVRTGHVLNESPGTLYLRPTYAPTSDDRYTFNPTILVGVPESEVPNAYELYQNYPNPFNPTTTIQFRLAVQSKVVIKIFNVLGQEVKTIVDGVENSGVYQLHWDGKSNAGVGVATGAYFCRIEANATGASSSSFTSVKKMLMLR